MCSAGSKTVVTKGLAPVSNRLQARVLRRFSVNNPTLRSAVKSRMLRVPISGKSIGRIADDAMARDHGQPDQRTLSSMDAACRMFAARFPIAAAITKRRKYVAMKLLQAARKGDTRLDALEDVARRALHDLSAPELQKDQVNGHGHPRT